jgi:ubiquinone/menaquinone biosynthesis C-methylase UbiE
MHHISADILRRGLCEMRRVLRPAGRLLIVDFKRREGCQLRQPRFGSALGIQDFQDLLRQYGFTDVKSAEMTFRIRSLSWSHNGYG